MSQQPDVTIGNRQYRFAVPAEEAQKLKGLAARVDALLSEIKKADPLMDRDRQLILTCLQLMADLSQSQQQQEDQSTAVTRFHRHLAERLENLLP